MNGRAEKIRFSILAPLTAAVVLLLCTFVSAVYWFEHRGIHADVLGRVDAVQRFFAERIEVDARILSALSERILADEGLQDAWLVGDRDALLAQAAPLFERFCSQYQVTHFYVHDVNQVCFVRAHEPSRYGDKIDRFTLRGAAETNQATWGIELGPLGTFTLRVVHPWQINGRTTGFVELGREIHHITPEIKQVCGVDVVFVINKSYLNRSRWEQARHLMSDKAEWDALSDSVVADSTGPRIPRELSENAKLSGAEGSRDVLDSIIEGRRYGCGATLLVDAGGRKVGKVIVMRDITASQAEMVRLLASMAAFSCIVGGVLFVLFYLHIGRIENRLAQAYANLRDEVERRKQTEKELQEHREHLQELVEQRTAELRTANEQLIREVAEREKVAGFLRESEQRFRQVADNAREWIWEVDAEGTYTFSSPAVERILGYKPEEIVGRKHFHDFFHPDDREELTKAALETFSRKLSFNNFTNRNIHRDGRTVWLSTSGVPLLDDSGNLRGYRGIDTDVTERKCAEEALEKLNQELQATVGELIRSNSQLRDFIHLAAHDLKTPLRGIGTLADWIADDYGDKLDDQGRQQIRLLLERVHRMGNLIDAILQYSRIRRSARNERVVDLQGLAAEVVAELSPPDNIKIVFNIALPPVVCQRALVKLVFYNLLRNAVTFMDKPSGLITIGCEQQGDFWRFSVADNGPGIEHKYFEKIFQIFQALSPAEQSESTGSGLAVAKKIVELYGGKIWLESEIGRGTTFFFTLPKQAAAIEAEKPAAVTA